MLYYHEISVHDKNLVSSWACRIYVRCVPRARVAMNLVIAPGRSRGPVSVSVRYVRMAWVRLMAEV